MRGVTCSGLMSGCGVGLVFGTVQSKIFVMVLVSSGLIFLLCARVRHLIRNCDLGLVLVRNLGNACGLTTRTCGMPHASHWIVVVVCQTTQIEPQGLCRCTSVHPYFVMPAAKQKPFIPCSSIKLLKVHV